MGLEVEFQLLCGKISVGKERAWLPTGVLSGVECKCCLLVPFTVGTAGTAETSVVAQRQS